MELENLLDRFNFYFNKVKSLIKKRMFFYLNFFRYNHLKYGTLVEKQLLITNRHRISLGKNILIFGNGRIELITSYSGHKHTPTLEIGDYTQIHQNCHITCGQNIKIGKNVVIVSNVTITDILHPHANVEFPINLNPIKTKPVIIEDEVYVYNNVVILPGVKIGKHSIVAANSLVNSDVEPYSIVAGSPAKIIKKFNFEINQWENL